MLIRLAKALAEPLIRANGSELRVEQGSGDLALAFLPLTLQFNQFPLVFSASARRPVCSVAAKG